MQSSRLSVLERLTAELGRTGMAGGVQLKELRKSETGVRCVAVGTVAWGVRSLRAGSLPVEGGLSGCCVCCVAAMAE